MWMLIRLKQFKKLNYFLKPNRKTKFQSQPHCLLDESIDSSDEGLVEYPIQESFQEPEVEPQTQKK
jgi:hypothetical protein